MCSQPKLPADCRRCSLVPHTLTSVASLPDTDVWSRGICLSHIVSTIFAIEVKLHILKDTTWPDHQRCSLVPHTLTSVANTRHVCELNSTQDQLKSTQFDQVNSICRRCSLLPHTLTSVASLPYTHVNHHKCSLNETVSTIFATEFHICCWFLTLWVWPPLPTCFTNMRVLINFVFVRPIPQSLLLNFAIH